MTRTCKIIGCSSTVLARSMCSKHYTRWRRNGSAYAISRASPGTLLAWLDAMKGHSGNECLLWPFGRESDGYGMVRLEGRQRRAHQVMCEIAHGVAPPSYQALHRCGKGHLGCINPRHLYWGSRLDNARDAKNHGVQVCGERNGSSRLTRDEVVSIRRALSDGATQKSLAEKFGVDQSTISLIGTGKRWAFV